MNSIFWIKNFMLCFTEDWSDVIKDYSWCTFTFIKLEFYNSSNEANRSTIELAILGLNLDITLFSKVDAELVKTNTNKRK